MINVLLTIAFGAAGAALIHVFHKWHENLLGLLDSHSRRITKLEARVKCLEADIAKEGRS